MAKDPKKRQKKLQKKNAKRKEKRSTISRQMQALTKPSLSRAKDWPLHEVWMTEGWSEPEQLIQILVARRGPNGYIAIGNMVIDTMCMGAKNAYGFVVSDIEYDKTLRDMQQNQILVRTDDVNLVAKIVRDSVVYARELGINPNRDLTKALRVLGPADPDACLIEIPLGGPDGRPYFFGGPYDDYNRIIAKLTKAVGPNGFTYTVPIDPSGDSPFGDIVAVEPDMSEDNEE